MAFGIEEQILRLDVPMCDALTMQIRYAGQDLLEAALDFGWGHAPAFDSSIKIATGTELHDLAPVKVFVLDEVNRLDDVDVM